MTHGTISGSGHGPRWESKCGSDLRIQHGLGELADSSYGQVVAFYSERRGLVAPTDTEYPSTLMSAKELESMELDKEQASLLRSAVSEVDDATRAAFEKRFDAWKAVWRCEEFQHHSDPAYVRFCKEFQDLVLLGQQTIPLIVEKLVDPDNFLALQLHDALQPDDRLLALVEPEDDAMLEGEQGRAERVVESWLKSM
jgi:hypothetical protein